MNTTLLLVVCEAVYRSQLADARIVSLSKLETELTEYAEFINKKVTFKQQIKNTPHNLENSVWTPAISGI